MNYQCEQMRSANNHIFSTTIFVLSTVCNFINGHATKKDSKAAYANMTQLVSQAIRTNREILEERSWDEFPVVHDYFYENEEGYIDSGGHRREYSNDFQPLCQNVRRRVELKSELYEYFPSHYVETVCRKFTPSGLGELSRNSHNQMCSHPGFACVQRTQTIFLTRKRYDSDCWESSKEVVASGCDCMWPGSYRSREI